MKRIKNVLWVDKNIECYKFILIDKLKETTFGENVNIEFFSNFEEALNTSLKPVDFVISNYNSFFWSDYIPDDKAPSDKKKYCFFLYEEITKKFPLVQFILHTALPHTEDPLISIYDKSFENFHFISKNEPNSIKNILSLITGELDLYELEARFGIKPRPSNVLYLR